MKILFFIITLFICSCAPKIVATIYDLPVSEEINLCLNKESLSPFADGDGTSLNPYLICSSAQLNEIGSNSSYWNLFFKIGQNIDLSTYNSNNFNPIGGTNCATSAFTGEIDGNSKKISNLSYNLVGNNKVALFPCFNGT